MAKVTQVQKARKPAGNCSRCGTAIKTGDSYFWFANRIGRSSRRKNYCGNCRPRPSEITTSDKLSELYAAQESIEDSLNRGELNFEEFRDQVKSACEDAASTAHEVADQYRESKDNLPENFQNSTPGEELDEKADQCDNWAEALESAASEIESTEQDDSLDECLNCSEAADKHPTDSCVEFETPENETGFDDIEQLASDAAGALEL